MVDRALALADSDGLDALTIRRLATELGVTPMALYWHFRSKEELIAGLADRIWGEIRTDVDPADEWAGQLRGMLESLIDVLRSHSSASTLLLSSEKLGPSHWQATEATLEILRTAGFDPEHASEIARSALWTGLTLVMSEPGFNDAGLTEPERAEIQRRKQIELASLPPDRYPAPGRGGGADDLLRRRPGVPLQVRDRPVHRGRSGAGAEPEAGVIRRAMGN